MKLARTARKLTRSALALLTVVAVLASVVLAGHRYFRCAMMNEVSLDACCSASDDASRDDGPAIDDEACCAAARFAAPAPGTFAEAAPPLEAPLVATLPPPAPLAAPTLAARPPSPRLARDGPRESGAREHRLRSMVFLT